MSSLEDDEEELDESEDADELEEEFDLLFFFFEHFFSLPCDSFL